MHNTNCAGFLDNIISSGGTRQLSGVPESAIFDVNRGAGAIFITPNATKHFDEIAIGALRRGASNDGARILAQVEFDRLNTALQIVGPNPTVNQKIFENGFELVFRAPRQAGQLPALVHAIPIF
ncbi:MAG: hypothetical protein AAGA08_16625 [Pseudomonadota bacterium]